MFGKGYGLDTVEAIGTSFLARGVTMNADTAIGDLLCCHARAPTC